MNIVDYVESQMEDFKTATFNRVDSLVLSQFSLFILIKWYLG